ncbi:hypothetical protein C491_04205 [Natronococcus amylolyticus DSM 10524]|uniref:Uncharacterized protein n=1 Tax=Natronococcus amylolyticus DSM 10524 TaxID=1227497 RepID=L9XFG6_9EURY|nr:hypothetical protein C491_04205 [Natronococcus amylolyticus DSM 10524]
MFEALFPEIATAVLFLIGIVCMIILLYISTQW